MERNITLDYFKLILSILVVLLHSKGALSEIPYIGWGIQQGISRIAVPCFFIINGFYLKSIISDKEKTKKYFLNLFKIYLVWMLIYIPFQVPGELQSQYHSVIIVLSNLVLGWGHLWYVAALLLAVVVLFIIKRTHVNDKFVLIVSFCLLLIGFCYQRLYLVNIDVKPSTYLLTRTFLFMGFPYVFIGYYIHQYNLIEKLKVTSATYFLCILLIFSIMLESIVLLMDDRHSDYYLTLPFFCPLLFMVVQKKGIVKKTSGFIGKLSAAIYFSHMFVLQILGLVHSFENIDLFIMTLFFTLLISTVIVYLNKEIKLFL